MWQAIYYVHVLESQIDQSWYIGYTPDNPFNRLLKHNNKLVLSTQRKAPWKVIYFEAYIERSDALGREKFLKSGSGRKYIKKQLCHYLIKKGK